MLILSAIVQKPTNHSILAEKSRLPAWNQFLTWFQVSESNDIIPPDAQRLLAKQIQPITISVNSSHA
jgi:hypothetical protein